MTENYSKEEREAWDQYYIALVAGGQFGYLEAASQVANMIERRRECLGIRPDERSVSDKDFAMLSEAQAVIDQSKDLRERLDEKYDKQLMLCDFCGKHMQEHAAEVDAEISAYLGLPGSSDDKPQIVKRSDLKAGEFYSVGDTNLVFMTFSATRCSLGNFVDVQYVDKRDRYGEHVSLTAVHPDDMVTVCDPPDWFSEVWERRRSEHDSFALYSKELRELLSAFIDAEVLPGFEVTREQWEQACILAGRRCAPFCPRSTGHGQGSETFDFAEAMRRVADGKKVTRRGWIAGQHLQINDDQEVEHWSDGFRESLGFSIKDIEATDWVEVG